MNAGLDDLDPGPPRPRPSPNLAFLDAGMDLGEGDAASFWHAVPAFSPVNHEEPRPSLRNASAPQRMQLVAFRTVALSVAFVLLVLAGAAASALVFADRFSRLISQ